MADWKKDINFEGVAAYNYGIVAQNANLPINELQSSVNAKDAKKMCDCEEGKTCSVVLVYK